jgi:putative ABC transport system permease protein
MFKNYLKSAIRALSKYKGTTFINILGLTIGLSATILISIYVINELSYDRFHDHANRIYRVGVEGKMMGNDLNMAVTSSLMTGALLEEYPEVETVTRIFKSGGHMVSLGDQVYQEGANDFLYTDSTFFDVFSFKLLQGDPKKVLTGPKDLVITETVAKKFFGDKNPIGQGLTINSADNIYTITGVVEDPPVNSHFHFKYLAPVHSLPFLKQDQWLSHNFYTYVLLKPGSSQEHFTESLQSLLEKYVGPMLLQFLNLSLEDFFNQGSTFKYITTKLTKIHLESHQQYEIEPTGNKSYVYIFSILGILILIVAIINFVNLATARSVNRSTEVGIRKLLGSPRSSLVAQFLTESTILSIISLILGVIIAILLIPTYNSLINSNLSFNPFSSVTVVVVLLGLGVLVGIIAGLYPAVALASTKPVDVLKGSKGGSGGKGNLRKVLVVFQFAVTLVILTSTFTAYRQLKYMQTKELGFEKENVLIVNSGQFLGDQYNAFRSELMNQTTITQVGRSRHIPGMIFSNNAHWLEGHGPDEIYTLMQTAVSMEWDEVMKLEMAEGRFFDLDHPTDSAGVIINESAARELQLENPTESRLWVPPGEGREAEFIRIIGVVKDFHFESMQQPIGPAVLYLIGNGSYGYICIKTNGENNSMVLKKVEETWSSFAPNYPLDSFWLEDFFDGIFAAEKRTSRILLVFSILSILISCLGLLGMISFTTLQRTKEIAIRKTYGSSIFQVIVLLLKETYILLLISTALAIPSYFLINNWMQNFAYKIEFNWAIFILTLIVVSVGIFIFAIATISQEATRAAKANPAEAFSQ